MDNKQGGIIQAVKQCLRRNGCSSCENCPYTHVGDGFECREKLRDDIIALLKAQEPIEPLFIAGQYECGECRYELRADADSYCPCCGRQVKWDE